MSDDLRPLGDEDPSADTERFRRFATETDPVASPAATGGAATRFRVLALVGGLVVLALLVWLILSL
jgi:hypothetical protein